MAAASLCALAGLQAVSVRAGAGGWACPFYGGLGVPCPGCGLTRACVALLRGDVRQALALHLFAAPAAAFALLLAAALTLPGGARHALLSMVEAIERRTRLTQFLLIGMVCYWLVRLALGGQAFAGLIRD